MRLVLAVFLCGLLIPATSFGAQKARENSRFGVFGSSCVQYRHSFDAVLKNLEAEGWSELSESDRPPLQQWIEQMELARDALPKSAPIQLIGSKLYVKSKNARSIFIAVAHMALHGKPYILCRLYDFEADRPVDHVDFRQWLGEPTPQYGCPSSMHMTGVDDVKTGFTEVWTKPTALKGASSVSYKFTYPDGLSSGALQISLVSETDGVQ